MTTAPTTDRCVAYRPGPWDLSELLPEPSETEIGARLAALEERVARFEQRRDHLRADLSPAALLTWLAEHEAIAAGMAVLGSYGSLWFAADTQSRAALTYRNRMEQALTGLSNRVLFFTLWWKDLPEEAAGALLPDAAAHGDWRHWLEDLRRLRSHTLEERAEQIINLKDANGIGAVLTLYSMLTNRLEYRLQVDGVERSLTRDELAAHFFAPQGARREAAYREISRVLEREATVLAQIYVNRVRDWHGENVELRRFASPIAVRNADNDLPDAAVETLLAVCRERAGVFQRYFRLKARLLGMDRLRRFDVYAPLASAERKVPYERAVPLVLDTFARFDGRFADLAQRAFTAGHVDSEIRKGKKGGAFCATVLPSQTPWLLVNFTGRVRDVATLAHELGHAVHSLLAAEHSLLVQHACLPLAETASVFAEMLLTDRLLAEEGDPAVRRELLGASLDDIYATVLRQAYFVLFEQEAHGAILAGRSPDELSDLYLALLGEQFGDSVEVDPSFRHEWLGIPHIFHTPFYCYAYSFGQLLVLSLYRRYQREGESFVPGYLRLLAYGGSARPQRILAEAGVDPADPAFWRGGFQVIEEMVAELEAAV